MAPKQSLKTPGGIIQPVKIKKEKVKAVKFVPNPVVPPLHECHPVRAGVLKMHVVAVAGGRLSNPASATPIQVSRKGACFIWPVSLGLLQ